ncbi:AMP-binding protein [Candidatus Woesearchaeota archaeon]|nr:AMP-binding protein [Candidatus Woesearchaeota archaeon]
MSSKLAKYLTSSLKKYSQRRLVSLKTDFMMHRYSYHDIFTYARKFVTYLQNKNIKKGDRIVICSYNCPQYIYAFIASILYGAILVPLDYSLSSDFIEKIIKETDAKLIITSIYKIIEPEIEIINVEELDSVLKGLRKEAKINKSSDNDLLQILYTSGTTSDPKGVLLTHENIYSNLTAIQQVINIKESYKFLSIIPLSHSFEQISGFFAVMTSGAQTIHMRARKPSQIIKLMQKEKVNTLVTVPAFLELLKKKIEEKARETRRYDRLQHLLSVSKYMPLAVRKALLRRVRQAIGKNLNLIVSGGAPLNPETEIFFENIGMKVVQGYGLTECSPVVTVNHENYKQVNSAGLALPGVKIKLDKQGEILVKGKNITKGYYKDIPKTNKLFINGWLKTGDIGYFDDRGFLFIKGRKKDIILKSSGLNVYPEDIELLLNKHPLVQESCVIGRESDGDIKICAVLLLKSHVKNPDKSAQNIVNQVNKSLEQHQKIQEHFIWKKKNFPKTPTLKIQKRFVVNEVEEFFRGKIRAEKQKDDLHVLLSKLSGRERIKEKDYIFRTLRLDSIQIIELSLMIEEKFHIEIDEQQINSKTRVMDLRKLIKSAKAKKPRVRLSKKYYWSIVTPFRFILQELVFLVVKKYCKITVEGYENIKGLEGQFLIVANHESHMDAPAILKHLPAAIRFKTATAAAADHFFINKRIIDHRILLSRIVKLLYGAYPFDRRQDFKISLEFTGELIDHGLSVLLFPEGGRTPTGKIGAFKAGVGIIVKESCLPVIPVRINGFFNIFPKKSIWPKKTGKVEILFGSPVEYRANESVIDITKDLEKTIRSMR